MCRRLVSALLVAALLNSVIFSQEKKLTPSQGDAVEVRFADGSVVRMAMQQENIDVVTRYGRLTVPAADIRRIEFGLRLSDEAGKRVGAAIAKLGAPDAKQRDAGAAELVALRELAYPALRKAAGATDAELARRATDALRALSESVPAESLRLPAHDTVVATEFTITGRVETPYLKAHSPYFGEARLNPAEVRNIRWLGAAREMKISVDAVKYGGAQDEWLDTGVDLRAGATIMVTATGTIQLGDGEGTRVGPDGLRRRGAEFAGGFPGGGGFNPAGGGPGAAAGRGGRAFGGASTAGTLLGRVGAIGRPFVLGSRFEGPAPDDGRLFLRIGPTPQGADSSGSYEVRVAVGR